MDFHSNQAMQNHVFAIHEQGHYHCPVILHDGKQCAHAKSYSRRMGKHLSTHIATHKPAGQSDSDFLSEQMKSLFTTTPAQRAERKRNGLRTGE